MSFTLYRAWASLIDAEHVFTRTCKITNEDVRTNVLRAYLWVLDAEKWKGKTRPGSKRPFEPYCSNRRSDLESMPVFAPWNVWLSISIRNKIQNKALSNIESRIMVNRLQLSNMNLLLPILSELGQSCMTIHTLDPMHKNEHKKHKMDFLFSRPELFQTFVVFALLLRRRTMDVASNAVQHQRKSEWDKDSVFLFL